mmetsp:Transcript_13415/g.37095  ORF Transcript_13415/g.37095 Transcript_13415/m.37095 type:complete len:201 (-) Transcript_13415:1255-1857(-)
MSTSYAAVSVTMATTSPAFTASPSSTKYCLNRLPCCPYSTGTPPSQSNGGKRPIVARFASSTRSMGVPSFISACSIVIRPGFLARISCMCPVLMSLTTAIVWPALTTSPTFTLYMTNLDPGGAIAAFSVPLPIGPSAGYLPILMGPSDTAMRILSPDERYSSRSSTIPLVLLLTITSLPSSSLTFIKPSPVDTGSPTSLR